MRYLPLFFSIICLSFNINAFEIKEKLERIGELPLAEQLTQYQQLLARTNLAHDERFAVLRGYSIYLLSSNQLDDALNNVQKALETAENYQLKQEQAAAQKLKGIVHYYKGEHQKALEYYQRALTYFQLENQAIEQANILNNMALVQNALGQHQVALESYAAAEPLYMKFGSEYDAVDLRANMAGLYIALRRFDQAIELLDGAIEYYQENNYQSDLARAKAELGVALKYSEQFPQAILALTDALTYYLNIDDKYQTSATLHNLSEVYLLMDLPQKGQAYASQGVLTSRESGHNKALVGNLHALAKAHFGQREYIKAQFANNEAISLAEKLEYNTSLSSLLMLNALIESAFNKPKKAIESMHKFKRLERNRFNSELNQLLTDSEAKQLKQKLEITKQKSDFQAQLNANKLLAERYFFAGVILLLAMIFLLYKRLRDRQLHKELKLQIDLQAKALDKVKSS